MSGFRPPPRDALENLDTATTDGQVVGFLSYRTIDAKPAPAAPTVAWGSIPIAWITAR